MTLAHPPPLTEAEMALVDPRLRLTPREQLELRAAFAEALPVGATVYLYGSRVDRNARGGDIDLLVHLPGVTFQDELQLTGRLEVALERRLGERKVDIVFTGTVGDDAKPFVRLVLPKARRLFQ